MGYADGSMRRFPWLSCALGFLSIASLVVANFELVGLTSVTTTPNAIVGVNTTDGSSYVIQTLGPTEFYTETAFDASKSLLYLFDNRDGSVLKPFDLQKRIWNPNVNVNDLQCQNPGCLSELRFDSVQGRIVAIGMGWGQEGKNAILSINPASGNVSTLALFDGTCASYLESSALDSVGQRFYAWLDCKGPSNALVPFDLKKGTQLPPLLETNDRVILSPMVVSEGNVIGINGLGELVTVKNGTMETLTGALGGIAANDGMTVLQGRVFISLVNYTSSLLAEVELRQMVRGYGVPVNRHQTRWAVNYCHVHRVGSSEWHEGYAV